ncbi:MULTISPECIES: STAS domain-containing protein [unclassified Streptomyces]|uniref:STAS domain-containing protein n=1 Tax=unclassified Streptomyces TaxID=2593676 RepID=UPI0022717267|nr:MULTISPECIES: STAS domain-containing protein [unclassified Streptomyces]MCY0922077.1 STAS domain-containing protein [Streptomyces sp. H27-G5]MCY0956230.1 STAS domain-containing protein [Streptomyces sp. H27-H5]
MDTTESESLTVPGPAPLPRDVAALCERIGRLARDGPREVACDVSALTRPGLGVVDAVARLALAARRAGVRLRLTGAGPSLRVLLALVGLVELLGEPEEREPPGGVQEGVEPDDLPV